MFRSVVAHSPATPITAISFREPRARAFLKEATPSPLIVMCNSPIFLFYLLLSFDRNNLIFEFFILHFSPFNVDSKQSLITRVSLHTHSVLRRSCCTPRAMADVETVALSSKIASSSASGCSSYPFI